MILNIEKINAGFVVKTENVENLASKIIYLLIHEKEARQMGERGRRYVVEHKSWQKITRQILELLKEVKKERIANTASRYAELIS